MNTFHVALYVRDLDAAIARYRKLLGQEPAKVRHDYAKFEISDPPVILSLNTGGAPGKVSHLGIRYPSTGDVASEMARAKRADRATGAEGDHVLLCEGGQVLGPRRGRDAVGDVHAARGRRARDCRRPDTAAVSRTRGEQRSVILSAEGVTDEYDHAEGYRSHPPNRPRAVRPNRPRREAGAGSDVLRTATG